MKYLSSLQLSFLALTLLAACGDDSTAAGGGGAGGEPANGGAPSEGGGGAQSAGGGGAGGEATSGPIDAPANEWTFVDFPGAVCMNGTPTGIAVNPHPTSDDVVIFLMGGNACFNFASCLVTANPDGYDATTFEEERSLLESVDWFDRDNPANPFRDFSFVYVPYCTGDVHSGDKDDVTIGSTTYSFHGYSNMTQYLERLVPTFPGAQRVVLTGVSAGGFGASYNYDQVSTAFGEQVDVTLIDDSGPPMAEAYVPACLQQTFIDLWGVDATLPADCAECGVGGIYLEPYIEYILDKYPTRRLGLVSSAGDSTIRQFWGYGNDDCANLGGAPPPYDAALYEEGLLDLRDRIADNGLFRLFLVPGTEHVFVDNGFGAVTVNGVLLEDWVRQAVEGDPGWTNVSEP